MQEKNTCNLKQRFLIAFCGDVWYNWHILKTSEVFFMGMSPDMFWEPSFGGSMAGDAGVMAVFGVLAIFYLIVALLSLALSVVIYIFHSLGLYTIANRRGIHHSWLAWLPVGNLWLLGSIADQYQYVVKGKIKNRRKVMLGLSIAVFAVYKKT